MKKLIAVFAPVLIATSLFAAPVSAVETNQSFNASVISASGGGAFHECFLEGNVGCQDQ